MPKTKSIFIIIFLLFVLMSGCSQKYLDSREEEIIDREILASWKGLDADVTRQYKEEIRLNVQIKDFVKVADSAKLKEIYKS